VTATATRLVCGHFNEVREGTHVTQTACKVNASWVIGVVFMDKDKIEETTIWLPNCLICNRHRTTLKVSDVMTNASWRTMTASLRERGHRQPKRGYTKLAFKSTKTYE
jgi:hypothetical protein